MVNGKFYIGKHETENPNDNYLGSGKLIRRAIEKYGIENFEKKILFVFDNEADMNAKEAELVTEEFLSGNVYNLCLGGQGGFGYLNRNGLNGTREGNILGGKHQKGVKRSKEFKQNLSTKIKSHWENGTYKNKNSMGMLDKKHTVETKSLMSQLKMGANNNQFGKMWITNGIENRMIKKDDPIPETFRKGRNMKF